MIIYEELLESFWFIDTIMDSTILEQIQKWEIHPKATQDNSKGWVVSLSQYVQLYHDRHLSFLNVPCNNFLLKCPLFFAIKLGQPM